MSNVVGLLLTLLILTATASAQGKLDEAAAKRLKEQADEMSRAFIAGDNNRMADFLHPKLIEMAGGRAKLVEFLDKGMKDMRAEGFDVLSYDVSEPLQVLKVGGRSYVVVSTKLRAKTPAGVYVNESYTVGFTDDGGANWKFVAASNEPQEKLAMFIPDIGKLTIPKPKPIALEPLPPPSPSTTPAPTQTPNVTPAPTPTPAP